MVKHMLLALAVVLAGAPPVLAQEADWTRSGGLLFVGLEVAEGENLIDPLTGPEDGVAVRAPTPEQPYAAAVAEAAARHGLDPKLLHALVIVESAYGPNAISHAGAAGLTQLMPATAAELGVTDRMDPRASLNGGAAYLARQVVRFGDIRLALAAYNAGPGRVARLGRIPDIRETQAYVAAVVDCYLALTAGRSARTARDCAAPRTG